MVTKLLNDVNLILAEEGTILKRDKLAEIQNDTLLAVLKFNFDVKIATNISKKKIDKVISEDRIKKIESKTTDIKDLMEFISYLEKECTGKDEHILSIQRFINKHEEAEATLLKSLAEKNFKIVIGKKEINKAIPGLIPLFEPQLAFSSEKYPPGEQEIVLTEKLDGNRVLIFVENSGVKIYSRKGILLEGLTEIEEGIKYLKKGYVYDGEVLADIAGTSKDKYDATSKLIRKKGEKTGLNFHIFDMLPIKEFEVGKSEKIYKERRKELNNQLLKLLIRPTATKCIKIVPVLYEGIYNDDAKKIYEKAVKDGCEGVMINIADGKYECKRTKNILKVKQFYDIDLRVVSVVEGKDDFAGMLGKVEVMYKGNIVGVGSGWNFEQRKRIWKDPENEIIGKIIKIKYFEESENESGTKSLRFPVILEVREDKTEESYD